MTLYLIITIDRKHCTHQLHILPSHWDTAFSIYQLSLNFLWIQLFCCEHFKDTVYEYYVDTKNKAWASFEEKLPRGWRYNAR